MNWDAVRVWAAIVLLLDASFGLWNHEKIRTVAPHLNIPSIALIEAFAALFLILLGLWR
jgi:hypothetical protein